MIICMSEKKILHRVIKLAEFILPVIKDSFDIKSSQTQMHKADDDLIHQYWDKQILPLL